MISADTEYEWELPLIFRPMTDMLDDLRGGFQSSDLPSPDGNLNALDVGDLGDDGRRWPRHHAGLSRAPGARQS